MRSAVALGGLRIFLTIKKAFFLTIEKVLYKFDFKIGFFLSYPVWVIETSYYIVYDGI